MRWAFAQPISRPSAKFVLVAMADCVNSEASDPECWPSAAHLCTATSLDRKTVLDAVRRLREEGFIVDTGKTKGTTGKITVYRLNVAGETQQQVAEPSSSSLPPAPKDPENDTVQQAQNRNDTESGMVPVLPVNGPVFSGQQSRFSVQTVPKTGYGTSKEPVTESGKEPKRARGKFAGLPEGFPEFWTEYPRKEGRTKALESWVKRGLDSDLALRDRVMAALARHRTQQQWTKDNGQFIPHASTWLNQERYLDDVRPDGQVCHGPQSATDDYWTAAGFTNRWEAENERCWAHNAHTFRDGKKLTSQAEVHA